jgi:uncharacterized BrkB/YihY/UPF0761 family membrane protein
MFSKAWQVLKFTGNGYIEDNCLSRGAAIAYYTVFSLAPVLIIVIAIEISSLMGRQGGEAIQTMIASASNQNRSGWAGVIGLITGSVRARAMSLSEPSIAKLRRTALVASTREPRPWHGEGFG